MKRTTYANKNRTGFALVELLIAISVLALMLSSLCSVYLVISDHWERQQENANAMLATSQACSKLSHYISQAVQVNILTRFTQSDTLAVNLPFNVVNGAFMPVWSNGQLQYQAGQWIIFYLSDSSGDYNKPGNILWAATFDWSNFPGSIVPDQNWSMHTSKTGKITPLDSIRYTINGDGKRVTIYATTNTKTGNTTSTFTLIRYVCIRGV